MRFNMLATAVALNFVFSPMTFADDPRDGFGIQDLLYPGLSATATLSNGDVLSFDGLTVERWKEQGVQAAVLATLPSFVFPSFLVLSPDESEIAFGESSTGTIYHMEAFPSTPTALTSLTFNYDAVFDGPDHLLISAANLGFGNGNQIYRVEIATGATTQIAQMAGASGPLELAPNGDLFYASSSSTFPAPAGSSTVYRWNAAQLIGAPILTELDAVIVQSGLDGAGSLVHAPDTGALYLAENNFDLGINRIRRVPGSAPQAILVEGTPGNTIGNLEWTAGDGVAAYLGYQPASGGTLRYNTTDFFSLSERRQVTPSRPMAVLSGPGTMGAGAFTLGMQAGAPGGQAIGFYCLTSVAPAMETALNFSFPLFLGLDQGSMQRIPGTFAIDAMGVAAKNYTNPGGLEGLYSIQFLMFDASPKLVGSSSVVEL